MKIPNFLQNTIGNAELIPATEGLSGAGVWQVEQEGVVRYYLKSTSEANDAELRAEMERMRWASTQGIPAPQVVAFGSEDGITYLLSTAAEGILLENALLQEDVITIVKRVGQGLRRLHETLIGECPFDMRLSQRLALAKTRLDAGEVDLDNFDEDRQGQSAESLWAEVIATQPAVEDAVFVHGDCCPPNILINPTTGELSAFIDWGRAGISDRYQDLALMLRELPEALHAPFLEGYGIVDSADKERVAYYQLLDEFF